MATLKTISAALKLIDTKKENLRKAYDDIRAHSSLISSFSLSWSELDSHFTSIHKSLTQRFHLLESLESQQSLPNLQQTLKSFSSVGPTRAQKQNDLTMSPKDPSSSSSNPANQNLKLPSDPSSSSNPLNQSGRNVVTENYMVSGSVMPGYELSVLCEKMDGKGLRKYVIEHFKDKIAIQAELPGALRCAPDPAAMVLESLDGFYRVNGLKDEEQRKIRRGLLEQLRVVSPKIGLKVREKAKKLAVEWKGRLMTDGAKTLEALGFLLFVGAYGLVSEVSKDELVDFSAMAANNEGAPELCRIIGLANKIPDLVQKLVDKGKHILAVKYVFGFNLTDKIPPVPILKACVDEAKKLAKRLSQEGKSLNEVTAREIHALKLILKVIESHKLESEYPPASLEQRIELLKKQKADRKRPAPASLAKSQPQPQPQSQQQQLRQKKKWQRQKQKQQQQSGNKHPRTFPVGPAVVQKNVSVANSASHQYQQPLIQPTGPSAGPYGFTGVPMGSTGNHSQGGSHLYTAEPNLQSGYYDRTTAYSGTVFNNITNLTILKFKYLLLNTLNCWVVL